MLIKVIRWGLNSIELVSLDQQCPTFLAPGTGFVEDNFSMDQGGGGRGG